MARTVIARSDKFTITEEVVPIQIDDCDGCGDSNVPCIAEVIDGERFLHCLACCEAEPYATSEDNNDEFWREDPGVLRWIAEANPEFISEPREDNPSYGHWEPSFTDWKKAHACDECSEVCESDEDEVKCPDGKIRCATCVEAMYRENGGE